jgi:ankyrin repeat protein
MGAGIRVRLIALSSILVIALLASNLLQCQEGPGPIDVTISDLSQHPQKFDGQLVRVAASLVFGWEGDNFMSDPNPQSIPSSGPSYLWFYCKPEREQQVYGPIRIAERRSVHGSFTGYFHFVLKPKENGMFDPGHLQFETIEVSIPEPQPKSLADAIREGDLEETRKILCTGPKLNILDEFRNLPLFEAIGSGHTDVAKELLAGGADAKLTSSDGATALMTAALHGDLEIAKMLLERGVPVDKADSHGETALILAQYHGSDGKMVQLLLDAGANPDAKTQAGMTALIAAARSGDALGAAKLLQAGADPTIKDKYGNTAESESCDRGEQDHFRVCELVRGALGRK